MIKKIEINNFKCFRHQEIKFEMLTVFAGSNGVGKSSIIQSMLLIRQLYSNTKFVAHKPYIAINDKITTFLELGSTREILNSESKTADISFLIYDEEDKFDELLFLIEKVNLLSLKSEIINANIIENPFKKFLHYLNAERLGPRNTQETTVQVDLNVGYQCEFTGQAIAIASKLIDKLDTRRQFPNSSNFSFSAQVESWLQFIIPNIEIQITTFDEINQVRIGIRKKGTDTPFLHPNNIGFGISYCLPIIVSALVAKTGSIIIVENPEAHLHPLGQSRMGQFLSKMSQSGLQIIIETHSEHIINGIRISTLKGFLDPKNVIINFLTFSDLVEIKALELSNKGELSDWPSGFFDQEERDLGNIFKLSRESK